VTPGDLAALRPRVGDLRQVASVRRVTLDDGPERGVRALAFSTGGGLDFWVLSDRSMDIGPLWVGGVQIAWQPAGGFPAAGLLDAESENGRGFNRGFSGFLVTCGMAHVRQPRDGHPLHGRMPFTPARVTAHGEDWDAPEPVLYAEGEVVEAAYGGDAFRLRRRIESPVGGRTLRVRDTVENLASSPSPHEMLYHFNLGWPVVRDGTTVSLDGKDLLGPIAAPEPAPAPARAWPCGSSPARVAVDGPGDGSPKVEFAFETDTLGHLQLWRDLRANVGVFSVEPCTSGPEPDAPRNAPLGPGERREYRMEVGFPR
jgi:hypothetical protein